MANMNDNKNPNFGTSQQSQKPQQSDQSRKDVGTTGRQDQPDQEKRNPSQQPGQTSRQS